jgi:hypothetical protein
MSGPVGPARTLPQSCNSAGMRGRMLMGCCAALALAAPQVAAGQSAVAVYQEPRHALVLDSARFRVLDVRISTGDTTLFHIHEDAAIYVVIGASPIDTQVQGGSWAGTLPSSPAAWARGDVLVDSTYAAAPLTHRVANVGNRLFRLLMVSSAGPERNSLDPYADDLPGTRELISTWFVQSRLRLEAQATAGWHGARSPLLLVNPLDGDIRVELESGDSAVLTPAGGWFLVPTGMRYRVTNYGATQAVALLIVIRS